ncbi:sulfatase, partial [candidate division KSB1 bacterium]|nr:sulfatase [candidate division KSB1 bacterium]
MPSDISRRRFLCAAGAGLTAGALAAWSAAGTKKAHPNILFIAIDDLNDWIGCLAGHPDSKTPNLDRLASAGVLFTHAYCAAPACNPSRAALMTGIRPSTSGVYHNNQPWRRSEVLKDAVTLPQYFRAHGYKAMGSGKIYHGRYLDPQSWDYYYPGEKSDRPPDPRPSHRPLNGIPNAAHFDWGAIDAAPDEMSDWQVADWIIGQLNETHDRPFFLACGFFRPHLPWYVPQKYFDLYPLDRVTLPNVKKNDLDDVPQAGREMARISDHENVIRYDQWRKAVQAYLASISFIDESVGRVVDGLRQSRYADNTIILLWSDHGWHLGEKLHWRKFALWEEATHNVLMCVAPGITRAGRCAEPVNLLDIYPTLVELAGLPA